MNRKLYEELRHEFEGSVVIATCNEYSDCIVYLVSDYEEPIGAFLIDPKGAHRVYDCCSRRW